MVKKIFIIVGARPNFIKIAALVKEFRKKSDFFDVKIIHTGQHFDYKMSKIFFKQLKIPDPDINLGIRSDRYPFTTQIALVKIKLQKIFEKNKPHLCIVVGDCSSSVAGAIAASTAGVPLAHIEAGLRSFDRTMSEETNRLITDSLSDFLFTPSQDANKNLMREGVDSNKIYFVGNIMIDTLCSCYKEIESNLIFQKLKLRKEKYGVLTLHRYNNVNINIILKGILEAVLEISNEIPLVFPIHPFVEQKIKDFPSQFIKKLRKNVMIINSLNYLDMMALLKNSHFVLTDSGGIQEESTFLKIPCLTLRENTERPATVKFGTNIIAGYQKESILKHFYEFFKGKNKIKNKIPLKWDGKTSERIIKILISNF
jgi:UDP-N-acetylglucosamine 2-epimerase (non-hydrolysing)